MKTWANLYEKIETNSENEHPNEYPNDELIQEKMFNLIPQLCIKNSNLH